MLKLVSNWQTLIGTCFLIVLSISSSLFSFGQQSKEIERKWYDDFKIDGYFQFQYAYTNKGDSLSVNSVNAGRFDRFSSNRFSIRRGRFQLQYEKKLVNSQFSFDLTETGFRMKDSWLSIKDPKIKAFTLTTGLFARKFGQELEVSSQDREAPERSMVIQHLFPGIRDLGMNLEFRMPKDKKLHFLKLDAGIFHGTSGNLESDNFKDITGRIVIDNPFKTEKFKFKLGSSIYRGIVNHRYDIDGSAANYRTIWRTIDTVLNINGVDQSFTIMNQDILASDLATILSDPSIARATYNKNVQRNYYSFHGEFTWDGEIKNKNWGKTTIRGEYIFGQQVSLEGTLGNPYVFSSASPTGPFSSVTWPKFDSPQPYNPATVSLQLKPSHTFVRNFRGWYLYFNKQLGNTKHYFIYRIDVYDPNTDIEGEQIALNVFDNLGNPVGSSGLSIADVAFTTHLFTYRYEVNENLSLMVSFEKPINEKTKLDPLDSTQIGLGKYPHSGFLADVKDDVVLIRLQYKF